MLSVPDDLRERVRQAHVPAGADALSRVLQADQGEVDGPRRAHFRAELTPPLERADAIGLVDADEGPIHLVQLREGRSQLCPRAPLVGGRSLVFAAPETARSLVFYKGEQKVGRMAVAVRPGELGVLGW